MTSQHRTILHNLTQLPRFSALKTALLALKSTFFAILFTCFALVCAVPIFAQLPEIGGLLPSGGLRGEVTKVRIDGKSLAGAHLHLSGSGIVVKSFQVNPSGEQLTAELSVDRTAPLGAREVRITTAKGVSNGSRFFVDVYPNHVIEQPMQEGTPPLSLNPMAPVVINSRISAKAGRDRFTLTANAGEEWVFDCFADRIRSRFDPVLEIIDEAGVSVRLAQSTWESDPRFCHRFAKGGRYFLNVRDSEYNGGSNYTYRLLVGRLPYVSHFAPHGGTPGNQIQLTMEGINVSPKKVSVAIPASAPLGTYWAEVAQDTGKPLLIPLLVTSDRILGYTGSNSVYPLPALPFAIDGVFTDTPTARFSFRATAQKKYLFDLLGRRIGSRIDGEIRILSTDGKEIVSNDDAPGLGKEARLEFTAPETRDYLIEIRNVEDIVGASCTYRLKACAVEPDFQISIATDRLAVAQGGTLSLPVTIERIGGFAGAVEVYLEGLPAGISAPIALIPADKPSVDLKIVAAANTSITATELHIRARAKIGGKVVVREAPAWEKYEHRSIDLLLSVEYSYTRPFHLWDMLLLAVTPGEPPKK